MYNITVSEEIKKACPIFKGAAVYAEVANTAFCQGLWDEINAFTQELRATETTDSIKLQPAIAATREAYKRCGKTRAATAPRPKHCAAVLCGDWNCIRLTRW